MIDLNITCNECGADLGNGLVSNNSLFIDPCKKCIADASDRGYEEGEADAKFDKDAQ